MIQRGGDAPIDVTNNEAARHRGAIVGELWEGGTKRPGVSGEGDAERRISPLPQVIGVWYEIRPAKIAG